ncbi:histone H1.3-like [Platysternon megacephalum]|uniref:Histone H1.3-like n=1 Tax=Platysternon megacephalum TaxID=55544 RepID=A0A4D9ERC5_9SAUR|nr:histone H1.3-like [Platysternon megacephalum]
MGRNKHHFQRVLENLVSKELLRQLKGTGALDSFTISKGVGKKKEKAASKKRGSPPPQRLGAGSLAERGRLVLRDLPREPGCQPGRPAAGQSGRQNLQSQGCSTAMNIRLRVNSPAARLGLWHQEGMKGGKAPEAPEKGRGWGWNGTCVPGPGALARL